MSLATPSKAERAWMDRISRMPCVVCVNEGLGNTPAVVHHLIGGGRRRSHLDTIPLCPAHHNSGLNNKTIISRHPWKSAFEHRYGKEDKLLEQVRGMVGATA